MKRLLIITIFLSLFIPVNSYVFSRDDLTQLSDVDLITVSSYIKDGVLKVSIFYKNRDYDKLVYWRQGSVTCSYSIYEMEGRSINRQRGTEIDSGSKTVTSFSQDFYIDIPESFLGNDKWGLIECEVDTGYVILISTDDFLLK